MLCQLWQPSDLTSLRQGWLVHHLLRVFAVAERQRSTGLRRRLWEVGGGHNLVRDGLHSSASAEALWSPGPAAGHCPGAGLAASPPGEKAEARLTNGSHKRVWSLLPWQLLAGRGGLGRAGPRGGRVHEALVHHPEAELLAGVHVQVVRPLLRLVLPHPHLLCFVAGQGAGSRQQPGRRGALRLGVPPKAPTPRKPNPKPSLLCLQSHRSRPGPGAGGQAGSGQPRAHREQPEDCSAGTQAGPTCGWHNATQQRGARAEPSWPLNVE